MNRGYAAVGLVAPKCGMNVGGAMRAAACYGASCVVVQGPRFKRTATDTPKAWRHLPVFVVADLWRMIPFDAVPVVIELADGAESLPSFKHPERAFYIFGPEDGSVPKRIVERASNIVQIPTRLCMNLAATVNVVLYDRLAKEATR